MENAGIERKRRAMTADVARQVRKQGHDDALEFALAIGLSADYKNDPHAKKDVIDLSGDTHSVKSGQKKWQIFLYGLGRFNSDDAFRVMNGIGEMFIKCLNAFPISYDEYKNNKIVAKEKLRIHMCDLSKILQDKVRLHAFLNKSLFNGGEVNYLTVKQDGIFHVFLNKDVVDMLSDNLEVVNSQARRVGEFPEQKVVFKYNTRTLGEIEVRHDSVIHYKEICFSMIKPKVMDALLKIPVTKKLNEKVFVHGGASRKFGRWMNKA